MAEQQEKHGREHQQCAEGEEQAGRNLAEDKGTREATCRTEDEIDARGEACLFQRQGEALHQNLGSRGVGAYVNAHVAHDAQEAKQDEGLAQEFEAVEDARCLVGTLLLNRCGCQHGDGHKRNDSVNQEEHPPT